MLEPVLSCKLMRGSWVHHIVHHVCTMCLPHVATEPKHLHRKCMKLPIPRLGACHEVPVRGWTEESLHSWAFHFRSCYQKEAKCASKAPEFGMALKFGHSSYWNACCKDQFYAFTRSWRHRRANTAERLGLGKAPTDRSMVLMQRVRSCAGHGWAVHLTPGNVLGSAEPISWLARHQHFRWCRSKSKLSKP